jgi:PAS domain S-box-containing protein
VKEVTMAECESDSLKGGDLQLERDRLRGILDELDLQVADLDAQGCYRYVNSSYAERTGLERTEILGRHYREVLGEETYLAVRDRIEEALAGNLVRYCVRLPRRDGELRFYETSYLPRAVNGVRDGVLVFTEDVTERQRAEEERDLFEERLSHAQRLEALGTLAGGIAHDFNNILGVVMGYTELGLLKLPSDAPVRSYMEQVLQAAERAKNVVQQILAFSRTAEQQRQPIAVVPLLKEVVKLLRATLPSTIEIQEDLDPNCSQVVADPSQLHQVVMNLCTNAYQAMRSSGGCLEVAVHDVQLTLPGERDEGTYVQLTVRDTGCGMPAEVRKRIFEPYFTTREIGEGTGMGLAVVHGIVTSLGGNVAVESVPGTGSTFRVCLPVRQRVGDERASAPAAVQGTGERVLFVDDEEVLARLGEEMLATLGYRGVATSSSEEALRRFREDPEAFDCVITDQTLPHMTGAELARELLALRPGLPVVLCTGHSELIDEQGARELGIRQFLLKPLDLKQLAAAVAAALGRGAREA